MKNEFKVHNIGQPDWVQLGVEVDAWDDCPDEKVRGVLIGYDRKSNYPYKVDSGDPSIPEVWHNAEPVRRWVPQPGELVVVRTFSALYLRVSAGGGRCIRDGQLGVPEHTYNNSIFYRLPEGVPLDKLSSDPEWWEEYAEKYEGGE